MSETKVCKGCNEEKEITEFYSQNKTRADGSEYVYYNPKCKECISKKQKDNWEHVYSKQKEYRKKNPQAPRDVCRRYRKKNLEKVSADQKRWRQDNPEKTNGYNQKYKEKQHKISNKQWKKCKEYFDNCCAYCGITEKEAKETQGKNLNKEHAINTGNNDLSNCIPSCTSCNSTKNIYDYTDWYTPDNAVYSDERYILIEQWLKEDYKKYI